MCTTIHADLAFYRSDLIDWERALLIEPWRKYGLFWERTVYMREPDGNDSRVKILLKFDVDGNVKSIRKG